MQTRSCVAIAAAACCVAGCSGAPSTSPALPAGTVSLDCSSPIGAAPALPAPYAGALDAVGFDTAVLQTNDAGGTAPHRLFAKTGLYVHAGRESTLTVPAAWNARLSIAWGNHAAEWVTSLHIPACPRQPGNAGAWLTYPGGFSLDTAACVPLQVRTDNKTTTVSISSGIRCPA